MTSYIITREEAINKGEKIYFTGKPCKKGHMSGKYVKKHACVECCRLSNITTMNNNRHKIKSYAMKSYYGISEERYVEMLKQQNYVCAICEQPETVKMNGKIKNLSVDHCHNTKLVRGLLCARCNQGIGLLKHNSKWLEKAMRYCS